MYTWHHFWWNYEGYPTDYHKEARWKVYLKQMYILDFFKLVIYLSILNKDFWLKQKISEIVNPTEYAYLYSFFYHHRFKKKL